MAPKTAATPRRARVRKLTPLCHTLADLEGGARSALEGAASCDMIFLSAAALVLICLAAAAFFAAILSATFNAHLAACLLLFRKVFGTSKVPNLLCWAKTPWSLRAWLPCRRAGADPVAASLAETGS